MAQRRGIECWRAGLLPCGGGEGGVFQSPATTARHARRRLRGSKNSPLIIDFCSMTGRAARTAQHPPNPDATLCIFHARLAASPRAAVHRRDRFSRGFYGDVWPDGHCWAGRGAGRGSSRRITMRVVLHAGGHGQRQGCCCPRSPRAWDGKVFAIENFEQTVVHSARARNARKRVLPARWTLDYTGSSRSLATQRGTAA